MEKDVNTSEETSTEENDTEEEGQTQGKTQEKTTDDTSGETAKEQGDKTQTVPYNRFKEVNDQKKQLEEELNKYKGKSEDQQKAKTTDEEWKERMEFVTNHDLGNAKKEKMDFITAYAKGKGISLEDAVEDELVKQTFQVIDQKVAKEKAIPTPSESGATHNKKSLSDLSKEEIRQDFSDIARKAIQAGKSKKRKELGI